jgi:hypothetical protein
MATLRSEGPTTQHELHPKRPLVYR